MKLSSLTVKRRPVRKGAFRTYFANVIRSKKHRASTAAAPVPEMDGDVPNLGIARALVVILVIHVVAIAGIFAHSHWFEEPQETAMAAKEEIKPAKVLPDSATPLPQVSQDDGIHIVHAGDTYSSIAAAAGVKEDDLRKANDNIELRAGRILRLPARTIVAVEPEELRRLGDGSAVHETEVASLDPLRTAPPMVETAAATQALLVKPALTRPTVNSVTANPEARAGEESPVRGTTKYTVKSGDTFWKIANAHKTTPAAIMKANRISDPKKLKVGMQLTLP